MTKNPGGSRWYAVVPKIAGTTGWCGGSAALRAEPPPPTRGAADPPLHNGLHHQNGNHPPTHTSKGGPAVHRAPYRDGCPRCVLTHNDPIRTEPINGGRGVLGHYRCSLCDHTWTCSWIAEPHADPAPPHAAASADDLTP